jgi:uncharacterized protein
VRVKRPGILIVPLLAFAVMGIIAAGSPDQRLLDAAKKGDRAAVRALLKQRVDVNVRAGDGATALHWAAHWDDLEAVNLLIAAGANVNAADDLGATPLWIACGDAGAAVVDSLLKAGANPNLVLRSGETPLMAAAHVGNLDAVKALLLHRADANAQEHGRHQTALMWAAAERHSKVVAALVEVGADVNARSDSKPLVVNTGSGINSNIVKGADDYDTSGVTEVQEGGYTPLLFAAQQGDIDSARYLIAAGANVNDVAPLGTSALVLAAHNGREDFGVFLLDNGADPNAAGAGYTALDAAILRRKENLVKALLAHGANPNAPLLKATPARRSSMDYALGVPLVGATPFWLAAHYGEPGAMRALAAGGAEVHFAMIDGTTALLAPLSIRQGGEDAAAGPGLTERMILDTVTAAVDLGANIDATNSAGNTAVHLAASKGFRTVVEFLASKGARLDVKNQKGQTPLALALGLKASGLMADVLRKLGARE